jgi:hypothetical protein
VSCGSLLLLLLLAFAAPAAKQYGRGDIEAVQSLGVKTISMFLTFLRHPHLLA